MQGTPQGFLSSLLRFTKVEHTIFSLPLVFSGAYIGGGYNWPEAKVMGMLIVAATGARVLGMAANRIIDRKIDAKNDRTANREIPSGRMSLSTATAIAAVGLVFYLWACFVLGPLTFSLSPIPVVVLIGYSFLKRFTPLCHYGIGLVIALAPLGAFVAVSQRLTPPLELLLLAGFGFFWISGFDIIYGLQDLEFDRENNVRSLPAWLGYKPAALAAKITHALASLCLLGVTIVPVASKARILLFVASIIPMGVANSTLLPLEKRFFPLSAIAGVTGALIVLL